jgi:hypothetical protein
MKKRPSPGWLLKAAALLPPYINRDIEDITRLTYIL